MASLSIFFGIMIFHFGIIFESGLMKTFVWKGIDVGFDVKKYVWFLTSTEETV